MTNQSMRGALRAARFAAAVLFVAACSNKTAGPGEALTGTVIPGANSGMPPAATSAAGTGSQAPTDPGSVGNADQAMPTTPETPPAMTGDVAGRPAEMGGGGDGQAGTPAMASAGMGGAGGGGGGGGAPAPDAAVPDTDDDDAVPDAGAPDAGWCEPDVDVEEERGL
jgi:hypothetical protein